MVDQPPTVTVLANQLCAPVPGGTGRYTAELVRALARRVPEGGRLLASASRGCAAAGELGVPVTTLPVPGPLLARLWERGLPPRPAREGVVHAPTLLVPPRPRRGRLVVTVHDVVPWTHPETLTARGVGFHRRMGRRAALEADLIVTPTEAVAAQVRAVLAPGCPVRSVWLGRSSLSVPPDATSRRRRMGLPDGYLLFVGTAEPRKGLDVLVEALSAPELAGRRLVVVGPPGWGDVEVADLAAAAGVGDRVTVTGPVSDADLAAAYASAQVLVMPSRAEGFGLPLVEAMALGVPVVTSTDPALVEVGGPPATVAPVGDAAGLARAIVAATALGPDREARVGAGLRRSREFSWDDAAATMWELYASL